MPETPRTLQRLLAPALLGLCVAGACARQGLPPGGPRDEEPPAVIATAPDSGAVRVPLDAPLEIEFTEPMNKASVIDWVLLSPPRDFGKRTWNGNRFRLSGGEDLREHTTYTVVVGTGCRDARERNPMTAPYTFVFATGDSIDQGRIEGRLLAKGQPAHGTMVWAIDLEHAASRPDTVLPDFIAQAATDSSYVLLGLRAERRYRVAAHYDANRDREFDAATEFLAYYPDTLWIDVAAPRLTGIDIDYRDPRAPGVITGTVLDSTRAAILAAAAADSLRVVARGDSLRAAAAIIDSLRAAAAAGADSLRTVAIADADGLRATKTEGPVTASRADSLRRPVVAIDSLVASTRVVVRAWPLVEAMTAVAGGDSARTAVPDTTRLATAVADTLGGFELRRLDPGVWRIEAFLDRNDDQRYDAGEPRAEPVDSVRVVPLETTGDVLLILRDQESPDQEE